MTVGWVMDTKRIGVETQSQMMTLIVILALSFTLVHHQCEKTIWKHMNMNIEHEEAKKKIGNAGDNQIRV